MWKKEKELWNEFNRRKMWRSSLENGEENGGEDKGFSRSCYRLVRERQHVLAMFTSRVEDRPERTTPASMTS